MPRSGSSPDVSQLLSPEALADAAIETGRPWAARASCASIDPDLFFPPGDNPAIEARQICAHCTVQSQCLAYSVIADEAAGVWGGLDHHERQALRRQLQRRGQLPSTTADSVA